MPRARQAGAHPLNPRARPAPVRCLVVLLAALLLAGCATRNYVADGDDARLMLRGNDPVAYQTDGRAIPGKSAIRVVHEGLVYRFASEANRRAFLREPARFVPAYGGYCASGAPYALKAAIGAEVFRVVDGRLYLFGSERSRRHWEMDQAHNIALGDRYWLEETRDRPARLQNLFRYTFRVPHYKTDQELEALWQQRHGAPAAAP